MRSAAQEHPLNFLPGQDGITEDVLIVTALAQASRVNPDNFTTVPYVKHLLDTGSDQLLIERLLSMAVKLRFLDDRTEVLAKYDRRLRTVGRYFEDSTLVETELSIRFALNKLIHHTSIAVSVERWGAIIVGGDPSGKVRRLIPEGPQNSMRVMVTTEGSFKGKAWRFELDLYLLLNEVLLMFETAAG